MSKMFKNKNGITLVALIITVIILLILAGVSIATLTGSGLFEKARLAEQESKNAQEKEEDILREYENQIQGYRNTNTSNQCSPKELMIAKIENSGATDRPVGEYYASKDFFKTTTTEYSKYLKQNEDGTWEILKSGYYLISNQLGAQYGSDYSNLYNYMKIGETSILLNISSNRNGSVYDMSAETSTIYLKQGDIFDFYNKIGNSGARFHGATFTMYAMFE